MDFDYTVTSKKSVNETVSAIDEETSKAGFRVLHIHDVTATLKEKGFSIEPYKIIEICNAKNAYSALQADPKIGLFLPCRINVYQKGGKTYISGMRPLLLSQFFPKTDLGNLPIDINTTIKSIIDKSK